MEELDYMDGGFVWCGLKNIGGIDRRKIKEREEMVWDEDES